MSKIHRAAATRDGELAVSADAAWELLTDWVSILKWWDNTVPGDAMYISSVHLEGGEKAVPRTRVITRSNALAAGLPLENRETLFLEDREHRRVYYDADDDVIAGVRNYIASAYIDEITPDRCSMTFSSRFDVAVGQDPAEVKRLIESIYDGIISGFKRYFDRIQPA